MKQEGDIPSELRLTSMETAVLGLASKVEKLTNALSAVGELSRAQQEQYRRQAEGEARAVAEKALTEKRFRRAKAIQRVTVIVLVLAVTIGPLIAYAVLTRQVSATFHKEQQDLTSSCALRNYANVEIPMQRELSLAVEYRKENNFTIAAIHQHSAELLRTAAVDCSIYLRKK